MKGEVQLIWQDSQSKWLVDERYQAILHATRTIAFEFDPVERKQAVSPLITDFIAGRYDGGRLLSDAMLEDGVIHPDDVEMSVEFREKVSKGQAKEMTLRLMTPEGAYRWFKMTLIPCQSEGSTVYLGVIADVDAEVRHRELLRYRAEFDSISGVYTKSVFYEKTRLMLESSPDQVRYLVRFDISNFKMVNEMYSISEGDRVLKYLGGLLRESAAPGETYARLGNDVFCICLSRTEQETLDFLAELERKTNQYPLSFQFILSAGILRLEHYRGEAVHLLCDWAAMAQRTIKGNYIQHYAFYEKSMSDSLGREQYLTSCMERALRDGQFQIYLQPKYDMRDSRIIGAEALARWRHPKEGMISPGEFIPLFERNGFILRLDEYIWDQACQTLSRWLAEGGKAVPISVNVSRIHLHDPEFCQKLEGLLKKYQIPPSLLELEITESAYTECPQTLYGIMDQLQESGFIFSMDDFGSGYSSLNVLKDIPVDIVKIDLNFLRKARRGEAAGKSVLKGTVQLVKGMNLAVIAEGVETQDQADFLLSIGCTQAQGYYYAKPMEVQEFEKLPLSK